MNKHFNKRLLALILSAILLICACPLSVFASELNGMNTAAMPGSGGDGPPSDSTGMSDIDLGFDLDIDENFDTDISAELTEDIKLRDTFTKHYTDGKGKYYAVVFPEQVHYLENGEWKEIDNSLTLNKQGNAYISGNKSFKTGFSKSSSSAELVTIEEGIYKLSWGISFDAGSELKDVISSSDIAMNETGSMTPVNARLTENRSDGLNENGTAARITKENIGDLGKAFSGISYDGILGDKVDLRYSVLHGKVKEDVILNSASDFRSYTLTVNTYGLNATKLPDNRVSFKNSDGETIFTIGTPWMKDSDASVSDNIAVTVIQNGTTAYIKYEPDREWLNDAERVYPVLIDPDVTTRTFKSNYIDTYVYEGDSASSARANETTMIVGNNGGKIHYSYLKILDIPELPGLNYRLRNIKLYIPTKKAGNQKLNLYEVTQPWNPNTITYANQPSSELIVSGASRGQINLSSWEDSKLEEWVNISAFFQSSSWNGFKIAHTANVENDYTEIYTSESSTSRPYMYFEYIHVPVESIKDNAVYSFVNSASGKYLTVHNGLTDNGTNIYQYTKNNTLSQAFRLSYNSIYDYFYIRSMCSNSLLRFNYGNDVSETGYTYTNVYLEEEYDNADINTEWLIVPHGNNDLFKVVSAGDPNLALTAYGTANGTASGTTNTSAGNVFVSRFTGASNQLWKLESGGCQVSSYAEDIRDVTQSKTVSESSTTLQFVCPVENFGDYITWSSSNQAVATVSDDGKVTAKKAGYTTISAYISLDGDEEEYTCDVYVRLADGTYYINNVNNNFCIKCLGSIPYENSTLVGSSFYGTSEPTDRSQMFKIKYLGNGCYSVRSMLDNSMGWANVSNKLVMTTIGTSDSSIPANAKWVINSSTRGYYFRIPSTASMAITSPTSSLADITINSLSLSNTSQMWTIKPITASYHGVTIKNSVNSLVIDDSSTFTAAVYSTYNSFNGGNVTWSVSNGTGSATVNSSTGRVTGVSQGTVTVTATYKYSYSTSWTASKTLTIIPLADGTYYFTNIEHDQVLQSTSNDTKFKVSEVDGETDQRWRLELVGNFEYKIISLVNNKAVTAPTSLNDDLTLTDYTAASNQRWLITVLGNAQNRQYKLSPASSTANYMAAGDTLISSTPNVELRANRSDNKDEWKLAKAIYGSKPYIVKNEKNPNCHGYAMMRNDAPKDWNLLSKSYAESIAKPSEILGDVYTTAQKKQLADYCKIDFENWLTVNGYTYEYESNFHNNGSNKNLEINQYRVVMRTGYRNVITENGYENLMDYHFWYQTYNGQWANKHGQMNSVLLPENVTPYTEGTSGWDLNTGDGFYDSPIYVYIITVSDQGGN